MRDLTSRLREIVRQPIAGRAEGASAAVDGERRELTYVPDLHVPAVDLGQVAAALGGTRHEVDGSSCIAIERIWDGDEWHGRNRVEAYVPDPTAPIDAFDARLTGYGDWAKRVVFFDIETTGLSGGAGTLPLIAACGWFDQGRFVVRQFFLTGPAGERAMLDALTQIFGAASLLVTYNGRSFDVPVMETRWAFHRRDNATDELPHFDMLPTARRLWDPPCTLSSIERSVLRFHRLNDVPGLEIPSRYFQFLRSGDPSVIHGVLEHNRHDVISLAAVMGYALRLAAEGPESCERATEQLGLGCFYERAGDLANAERAYILAGSAAERDVAAQALARLAVLLRRRSRYPEAAEAWQRVLACSADDPALAPLEQRAAEALAIHHEHRARDLGAARRYAEALRTTSNGRSAAAVDHRIGRLERKIRKAEAVTNDGGLLEPET